MFGNIQSINQLLQRPKIKRCDSRRQKPNRETGLAENDLVQKLEDDLLDY